MRVDRVTRGNIEEGSWPWKLTRESDKMKLAAGGGGGGGGATCAASPACVPLALQIMREVAMAARKACTQDYWRHKSTNESIGVGYVLVWI